MKAISLTLKKNKYLENKEVIITRVLTHTLTMDGDGGIKDTNPTMSLRDSNVVHGNLTN